MNIEEIMKPYFDKKKEFDKKYIEGKNFIKLRLERLRDNKEREINEYVQNAVAENQNFYTGYGAMIRKDLEQSYAAREQELEEQLRTYDKFYRVDVREIVDIKHEIRKELYATKKELELKYKEETLNLDVVMLKLTSFKYTYDENHNVTNRDEYRRLFEQSNSLIEVKYSIENQLKKIEEYINLTELTQEEVKTIMGSMTSFEKEEYERRKALVSGISVEPEPTPVEPEPTPVEPEPTPVEPEPTPVEPEPTPVEPEPTPVEPEPTPVEPEPTPVEPEPTPVEPEPTPVEPVALDDNVTIAESAADLINMIFNEVVDSAKTIRKVDLQPDMLLNLPDQENVELDLRVKIELPNGEYINKRDISKALDKYVRENKGRKFGIKGYSKTLELPKKAAKQVKKALKECSIIKLLREKKIGYFDVKRVYGKAKADEYSDFVQLGQVETKLPAGDYVNLREFYGSLTKLFAQRSPNWIERFTTNLKQKINHYQEERHERKQKTR